MVDGDIGAGEIRQRLAPDVEHGVGADQRVTQRGRLIDVQLLGLGPVLGVRQVEIRVPNPTGALLPGSYVQVTMPMGVNLQSLVVPTNVLLFRPEGTRVAVVDSNGRVHLNPVKLGTDFGTAVEVLSGIGSGDHIIVNPADALSDGDVVTLAPPPQPQQAKAP